MSEAFQLGNLFSDLFLQEIYKENKPKNLFYVKGLKYAKEAPKGGRC